MPLVLFSSTSGKGLQSPGFLPLHPAPNSAPCMQSWSHTLHEAILQQEKVIFNDPRSSKGQSRRHEHNRKSYRSQGSGFTSKPARSATQGHINVHPSSWAGKSRQEAQNSLVFQTTEKSQRVAIVPCGPPPSPTRGRRALGVGDSSQVSVTLLCVNVRTDFLRDSDVNQLPGEPRASWL